MNYLAQGLDQGFKLGADARDKRKDREERERLDAARRAFELDVLAKRNSAEKQLQDDRLVADAARQFSDQGFRAGEGDKERGWRTGERTGTQDFTSGESTKERDARTLQAQLDRDAQNRRNQQQLDEAARQFNTKLPLEGAELGLKGRAQDWQESPDNPLNEYRRRMTPPMPPMPPDAVRFNGGAPSPIGQPAPAVIFTQQQYDNLPSKARFNWNGRVGTKP